MRLLSPPRLALLTCLALCLAGSGPGHAKEQKARPRETPPSGSPAFKRGLLDLHNEVRAKALPRPSPPLPPLRWSDEAAQVAQAWASQCRFEHNPRRGKLGENIAAATPGQTVREMMQGWASEAAHYDRARNTCAKGKVCGHYTQLVWRSTTHVGCATQVCTRNSPFGPRFPTWRLWVCNYSPQGNTLGEKPY